MSRQLRQGGKKTGQPKPATYIPYTRRRFKSREKYYVPSIVFTSVPDEGCQKTADHEVVQRTITEWEDSAEQLHSLFPSLSADTWRQANRNTAFDKVKLKSFLPQTRYKLLYELAPRVVMQTILDYSPYKAEVDLWKSPKSALRPSRSGASAASIYPFPLESAPGSDKFDWLFHEKSSNTSDLALMYSDNETWINMTFINRDPYYDGRYVMYSHRFKRRGSETVTLPSLVTLMRSLDIEWFLAFSRTPIMFAISFFDQLHTCVGASCTLESFIPFMVYGYNFKAEEVRDLIEMAEVKDGRPDLHGLFNKLETAFKDLYCNDISYESTSDSDNQDKGQNRNRYPSSKHPEAKAYYDLIERIPGRLPELDEETLVSWWLDANHLALIREIQTCCGPDLEVDLGKWGDTTSNARYDELFRPTTEGHHRVVSMDPSYEGPWLISDPAQLEPFWLDEQSYRASCSARLNVLEKFKTEFGDILPKAYAALKEEEEITVDEFPTCERWIQKYFSPNPSNDDFEKAKQRAIERVSGITGSDDWLSASVDESDDSDKPVVCDSNESASEDDSDESDVEDAQPSGKHWGEMPVLSLRDLRAVNRERLFCKRGVVLAAYKSVKDQILPIYHVRDSSKKLLRDPLKSTQPPIPAVDYELWTPKAPTYIPHKKGSAQLTHCERPRYHCIRGCVSKDDMLPIGCHIEDHDVPALVALNKGETLRSLHHVTFQAKGGKLLADRLPFGRPCLGPNGRICRRGATILMGSAEYVALFPEHARYEGPPDEAKKKGPKSLSPWRLPLDKDDGLFVETDMELTVDPAVPIMIDITSFESSELEEVWKLADETKNEAFVDFVNTIEATAISHYGYSASQVPYEQRDRTPQPLIRSGVDDPWTQDSLRFSTKLLELRFKQKVGLGLKLLLQPPIAFERWRMLLPQNRYGAGVSDEVAPVKKVKQVKQAKQAKQGHEESEADDEEKPEGEGSEEEEEESEEEAELSEPIASEQDEDSSPDDPDLNDSQVDLDDEMVGMSENYEDDGSPDGSGDEDDEEQIEQHEQVVENLQSRSDEYDEQIEQKSDTERIGQNFQIDQAELDDLNDLTDPNDPFEQVLLDFPFEQAELVYPFGQAELDNQIQHGGQPEQAEHKTIRSGPAAGVTASVKREDNEIDRSIPSLNPDDHYRRSTLTYDRHNSSDHDELYDVSDAEQRKYGSARRLRNSTQTQSHDLQTDNSFQASVAQAEPSAEPWVPGPYVHERRPYALPVASSGSLQVSVRRTPLKSPAAVSEDAQAQSESSQTELNRRHAGHRSSRKDQTPRQQASHQHESRSQFEVLDSSIRSQDEVLGSSIRSLQQAMLAHDRGDFDATTINLNRTYVELGKLQGLREADRKRKRRDSDS